MEKDGSVLVQTKGFGLFFVPLWAFFLFFYSQAAFAKIIEISNSQGTFDFMVSDALSITQFSTLQSDLAALAKIDLLAPRSATSIAIFGVKTKNYLAWFAARVQTFDANPHSDLQLHGKYITYTAASYQPGHRILLDDYILEPSPSVRMATLIHEARHGDHVHHVTCTRARYSHLRKTLDGQFGGCDSDELGAYGAQFIFESELLSRLLHQNETIERNSIEVDSIANDLDDISGRFLSATSRKILGSIYRRLRKNKKELSPLTW